MIRFRGILGLKTVLNHRNTIRKSLFTHSKPSFSTFSGHKVATYINETFLLMPGKSMFSLVACEMTAMMIVLRIIQTVPILSENISGYFAVAFGISRLIRRFRYPLDFLSASLFVRICPSLKIINLTNLMPFHSSLKPVSNTGFFAKLTGPLYTAMEKYGFGLFLAMRLNGAMAVIIIWQCLERGVFIEKFIEKYFGVTDSSTLGDMAGSWAAAVVFSSIFYPFSVAGSALLARRLHKVAKILGR